MTNAADGIGQLVRLGEYKRQFESEGFTIGEWRCGEEVSPGVRQMPWFDYSDAVIAFIEYCYKDGWVLTDFSWGVWKRTTEAIDLARDPAKLACASAEQLAKLLTVIIRQDRFNEGSLACHCKSGLLLAILRRARVLGNGAGDQ